MYYFAYGSNTNIRSLKRYLKKQGMDTNGLQQPQRAILHNYRLRTNYLTLGGKGAANIEFCQASRVEGILYSISDDVHQALRRKEGFPWRYLETIVLVGIQSKRIFVPALTYVVAPHNQLLMDAPVSQQYRKIILSGARQNRFTLRYQSRLRAILKTA